MVSPVSITTRDKNRTVQKFDIRPDGFPIETAAIRHSNKNLIKITLLCIKYVDKEHFKTRPKQSLAYIFWNAITLLTCYHCCERRQ